MENKVIDLMLILVSGALSYNVSMSNPGIDKMELGALLNYALWFLTPY